jgi:hypothetical protein
MLVHCFWVFGFKSWFEFKTCLLVYLELEKNRKKKEENQLASPVFAAAQHTKSTRGPSAFPPRPHARSPAQPASA